MIRSERSLDPLFGQLSPPRYPARVVHQDVQPVMPRPEFGCCAPHLRLQSHVGEQQLNLLVRRLFGDPPTCRLPPLTITTQQRDTRASLSKLARRLVSNAVVRPGHERHAPPQRATLML